MKRSISEEEYEKIAKANPFALNTQVLINSGRILYDFKYWVIVNNKYPYLEYNGSKVLKHLLIIPKNDSIDAFYKLEVFELSEITGIIKFLSTSYSYVDNNSNLALVYFWKEKGKSINKFHLHFLVLEI